MFVYIFWPFLYKLIITEDESQLKISVELIINIIAKINRCVLIPKKKNQVLVGFVKELNRLSFKKIKLLSL